MQTSIDPAESAVAVEAGAEHDDHAHPDLRVWGLLTFLGSEFLMFGGFFAVYLVFMTSYAVWPPEGTEVELLIPAVNTVILLSSSLVINKGTQAIKTHDVAGLRLWFGVTALMGAVFLGGQVYEYLTLGYGLTTNIFANCFYVMTGFHGAHVLIGVLLILFVLWQARNPDHYSSNHAGVEVAEIYWHFVDIIWIVVFTLIYLLTLF